LYCGHWFRKPALPLARCTGCAGFLRLTDWATVKPPSESSSSLPFLQSVAQLDLRPPAAAGGHLSWTFVPFSTSKIRRSTHHGRSKPATVRVQGLATLCAAFARRIRAGFFSRRQRSWDSPFGAFSFDTVIGAFPPDRTHLPFRAVGKHPARSGGPARRAAASGVCPAPESLATGECLARRPPVAPLGFSLSGFARHRLDRVFARPPLERFADAILCRTASAGVSESRSAMTCPQP